MPLMNSVESQAVLGLLFFRRKEDLGQADSEGRLIFPELTVTSVVERRHVWVKRIPNMDGVVRALVFGKLCYPRIDWRICPSFKPNHKSW